MKEISKLLVKEIIIVAVCAIMGMAALAITYLIPQQRMRDNVKASAIILHNQGLGAHIWETITETELDVHTDGLMLNIAYTETDDGIRDILLDTRVQVDKINPMESLYEMLGLANDNYYIKDYGRYWHGYQIILRPLLCVYTYDDILQINMILQLALVFLFVFILAKSQNRMLIVPFWGMYIFLSPISVFSSLQYSACFYVMMFVLIALFVLRGYMDDMRRNYLFLLAGILTAFFDLLTYPLITLGVPLIAYLGSDTECLDSAKKCVKSVFFYTMSWGIGYVGMWSLKWILASVLTEENIIRDAFEQLTVRSGHFDQKYTWLKTIKLNLGICNAKVLLVIFIFLLVYILGSRVKNHSCLNRRMLPCIGVILLVSVYPLLWYYLTMNHASNHAYFTWRELAISVFGIIMIGVINIERRNN